MKKTFKIFLCITTIIILLTPNLFAITQEEINLMFSEANILYEKGNYEKALEIYMILDKLRIKNSNLYYNIANTYMNMKPLQIGKAILYYNRALHYKNGDSIILKNLNLARQLVVSDNVDRIKEDRKSIFSNLFIFFNMTFNINTLTILIIILLTTVVILVSYYFFRFKSNKFIFRLILIFTTILIIFSFLLLIRINIEVNTNYGVVINNNINAYLGPSEKQQLLFTLSEGVETEIKKFISDDWYLIKLSNGLEGYIKSSNIEIIRNF